MTMLSEESAFIPTQLELATLAAMQPVGTPDERVKAALDLWETSLNPLIEIQMSRSLTQDDPTQLELATLAAMQPVGTPDERVKAAWDLWSVGLNLCYDYWDEVRGQRLLPQASRPYDPTPEEPQLNELATLAAMQPVGTPDERVRAAWEVWSAALSLRNKCRTLPPGVQRIEAAAARADDPTRRLRRRENGNWEYRTTVTTNPRNSGIRKNISLKTTDLEVAKERRDFAEYLLNSIGVLKDGAKAGIE